MANPLTGDFDAVLQVSGPTINRLLATMHQNTGLNTDLPTFPHSVSMRIGDPTPIDGMRGHAWVQLSVPRIDLIHGADDRFNLEVGIRARYKPDPGTTPLPEFIHGTVRAQYRILNIDPDCWGWGKNAADYLWIRVVGSTVSFDGTAVDDIDTFSVVQPTDAATNDARITRLAWYLLKNRFEATPQKVERRFRRGSMRSLNVGVNRSVVAVPLAGQGQLTSINQDVLDGRDFGVAISAGFIMSNVRRELEVLKRNYVSTFHYERRTTIDVVDIPVLTIDLTWTIRLKSATADWSGGSLPLFGTSAGVIAIKIVGEALINNPTFNMGFDLSQLLLVTFNAINEEFAVTLLGSPALNVTGFPAAFISQKKKQELATQLQPSIQAEVDKLVGVLSLQGRKDDLLRQLQKLDQAPEVNFEEAEFSPDGVVVRGHISLSPRRPIAREFVATSAGDGFDAFQSWIPGGRVDSFEWSWSWFNSTKGAGGAEKHSDRFMLRRPRGVHRSKFGMIKELTHPLPIIDGWGRMCLTLRGVRVHPVSGALVPVSSTRKCLSAGFDVRIQGVAGSRVFLRDWARSPRDPIGPVEEVSLVDVSDARTDRAPNTLVLHAGERWNPEIVAVLRDALLSSRRVDAGLQVLLLFPDGTLMTQGNIIDEVSRFEPDLEAPLMVNEDVEGTWSGALSINPQQKDVQWRLVTPTGGVSWGHTGSIDPRELGKVLDDYLFPSPPATARPVLSGITPGTRIETAAFDAGLHDSIADYFELEDACPPPLGPFTLVARVVFVKAKSAASLAAIKRLAEEHAGREEDRPFVALIVDGLTPEEVQRLRGSFPEQFVAIPDPKGVIASHFGVRTWPTAVTVTEGIVTAVDVGAEPASRASDSESAS